MMCVRVLCTYVCSQVTVHGPDIDILNLKLSKYNYDLLLKSQHRIEGLIDIAGFMEFGVDFGQKVDLTASIRNILRNYPEGTAILKVFRRI